MGVGVDMFKKNHSALVNLEIYSFFKIPIFIPDSIYFLLLYFVIVELEDEALPQSKVQRTLEQVVIRDDSLYLSFPPSWLVF